MSKKVNTILILKTKLQPKPSGLRSSFEHSQHLTQHAEEPSWGKSTLENLALPDLVEYANVGTRNNHIGSVIIIKATLSLILRGRSVQCKGIKGYTTYQRLSLFTVTQ